MLLMHFPITIRQKLDQISVYIFRYQPPPKEFQKSLLYIITISLTLLSLHAHTYLPNNIYRLMITVNYPRNYYNYMGQSIQE